MKFEPGGQPSNQVVTIQGTDMREDDAGVAHAFAGFFGANDATGA